MSRICVYCGESLNETSMEHIIQQALGGRYESADILCPCCNEFVGSSIDVPFNRIFNPIIDRLDSFVKQRKSSHPPYKGTARYEGKVYDVIIKNKRVVSCPELSRTLRNNVKVSELDFDILGYEFETKSEAFLTGLRKIAFNFAVDKKIPVFKLQHGFSMEKNDGRIASISFSYPVIPFIPLNPMDHYLELDADISLYHNLILFSQERHLWCYIDLFGTFQHYVLLSDNWDANSIVYEPYLQLVEKIDRTVPNMIRWRPKYGLIYSRAYDVPSSPERDVMKERVARAIRLDPYIKDLSKVISLKLNSKYLLNLIRADLSEKEKREYGLSLLAYFDESDHLIPNRYRQVTLGEGECEIVSYPLKIRLLIEQGLADEIEYQKAKIKRLTQYLSQSRIE